MIEEPRDMESWVDFDIAMLCVGKSLGLLSVDVQSVRDIKSLLWSDNRISRCLTEVIQSMVKAGYLSYDPDGERYKINPDFKRSIDFESK